MPAASLIRPDLSVVVPAFNEGDTIGGCLRDLQAHLEGLSLTWEIVVVDDGSTDGTRGVVEEFTKAEPRIRLVTGARAGKGAAVRRGMLEAHGAWRFMADADLAMPLDNLDRFLSLVDGASPPDVLIGSREAPGAERQGEHWLRYVIGRVFNRYVRMLVLPGITDTQCGFKLFSAAAVEHLFQRVTVGGFAFDVELLVLARRAGYEIREVGIAWHGRPDSRVAVTRGAAAFGDVLRVWWNAWTGRYGRRSAPRG
ncbi:MAG: glycosyltransferase family 2 protein [Acidobacteria bacterium]|nr:glycosyltransferase family 2 protein [Acidobacteriota bacterium]